MSRRIPEELIEKIRSENEITEVIEEYVQLKKQGKNYLGLCPFHNENTPSFSVAKDKQIFHCFGCGKGGNVFTFLMEIEHVDFIESVRLLADRSHIELPHTNEPQKNYSPEVNALLSSHEWLGKYYHHLLKYLEDGEEALDYLKERNVSSEMIETFQLGYSPSNDADTIAFLKSKDYHMQSLSKFGLVTEKGEGQFHDVFRGRLIFPIKNHLGKIVAFGGRTLTSQGPKYLNSPEHELFQKGHLLYNFHQAKKFMRKENKVVLFEGYLDVIQAYQSGLKNSVATLGTSLTMPQVKLLKRYVDTVILCYDGDNPGVEASYQATKLLQEVGLQIKVVVLPVGEDPDDYIRANGSKAFRDLVDASETYFSFYMRYQKKHHNLQIESEKIAYLELIIKALAQVKSEIELDYYVNMIAHEFDISSQIIYADIEKNKKVLISKEAKQVEQISQQQLQNSSNYSNETLMPAYFNAEKMLIQLMLQNAQVIQKIKRGLGVDFNVVEHQVIATHLYALYESESSIDISKLVNLIEDPPIKNIVSEIAFDSIVYEEYDQVIDDCIAVILEHKNVVNYIHNLEKKLSTETNPILAAEIGQEIINLRKNLS